jgi:polyisoprenoid-binding protein YceI
MHKILMLVILMAVSGAALAAKETYTLDPNHTYPNFTINHLGYSTMHGRFGKTSGKLTLDRSTMTGSVEVIIDAASVDTGMQKRDDHLRSPDFLNAGEFPEITYKADNVKLNKDGTGDINGKLTLAGVTKSVTLTVKNMNCATHPFDPSKQKFVCGFDASATIMRSDFGVKYGLPAISDEMQLSFEVEAQRD